MGTSPTHLKAAAVLRFGVFELEVSSSELRRQGRRVELPPQPAQLLALLVRRPGEVVTREEIRQQLWGEDVHVDYDQGINGAVRQIRTALGDSAEAPRFLETVPKRGYRFLAPVEPVGAPAAMEIRSRAFAGRFLLLMALGVGILLLSIVGYHRQSVPPAGAAESSRQAGPAAVPAEERVLLAVLPFEDLSPPEAGDQRYFSAGVTEELISRLGRQAPRRLGVIARTSVVGYAGTARPVREIGEELGVEYLLEGSVRRHGERVRITAQLVRTSDQTHLWGESYDHLVEDLLATQRQVAEEVTTALAAELLDDPVGLTATVGPPPATGHPEAYDHFLQGRYHFSRYDGDGFRKAIAAFERAVALDPGFAEAYGALAEAWIFRAWNRESPGEPVERAVQAARQGLELDDTVVTAHNALGVAALYFAWDFQAADEHFRRAVAVDPGHAEAHHWYAGLLSALGRHDEALEREAIARRLDPRSLTVRSDLCWYLLFAGRPVEALAQCRATLELEPYHRWSLHGVVQAGSHLDPPAPIGDAVVKLLTLDGVQGEALTALEAAPPEKARRRYWQHYRQRWEGLVATGRRGLEVELAIARAGTGDPEGAMEALFRAVEAREPWLVFLDVDPRFEPVRGDPRFQELRRKVGLP